MRAAEAAERVHAFGESAALFARPLALAPVADPETLTGRDHVALYLKAARANLLARDDTRAIALLEHAADELDPDTERPRLASVLAELASVQWSMGGADTARATLHRALDLAGSEPSPERALVLSAQVPMRLLQGRFGEVEEVAAEALATAEAVGLEPLRAAVLHRLGCALFVSGEYERGEEILRESLDAARVNGDLDNLGTAYANYADALNTAGRLRTRASSSIGR